LDKRSDRSEEPDVIEAMHRAIVRLAGEHRGWNDTREAWLSRAAKAAGITPRQAKALYYRETQSPAGDVVWKVSCALSHLDATEKENADYSDLERRINVIEQCLTDLGSHDGSKVFAHLCSLLRAACGADGSAGLNHAGMGEAAEPLTPNH
jgi:hypothetical protein